MCTKGVQIAPLIVKILLFIVLPLNVICALFSFVSPFWFFKEKTFGTGYEGKIMTGLWMYCEDGYQSIEGVKNDTRCSKFDDVSDYMNAARIFLAVGTFCVCLCLLGVIWFVIRLKGLRIIAFCNVLSAISAVSTTVGVTIYGIEYRIDPGNQDLKLHASFYIAAISAFLSLLSVVSISLLIVNYYSGSYADEMSSIGEKYPHIRRPPGGMNFRPPPPGKQMRPQSFEYGRFQSSQMPGVRY